jgi:Zn-dependent peptidase ImmA (M78 family)
VKSAEHSRFDASHELAHLTLHQTGPRRGKEIELEAHRFAAAFLMPRDDVLAHAPREPTTEAIVHGKKRWGVSAMAYARRLFSVGILREWHYKQLCIDMSRRGYRTTEPEPMQREQSQLLQKAFGLLKEKGIGRGDVARALSIGAQELDRLVFGLAMVSLRGEGGASQGVRPALRVIRGQKERPDRRSR